jgi:hypothetical protein
LVAFACDDAEVQPLLPQVFIGNEHVLAASDVVELNAKAPRNVFFVRRQSSWVNEQALVEIICLLTTCLKEVMKTRRVILYMDTYKAHLGVRVIKECTKAGVFLAYIPAGTTALLQPLDACVFSLYKRWVRHELEQKRLGAPSAALSRLDILDAYCRGIPAVLEARAWQGAFVSTGLRGQDGLSQDLTLRLQGAWRPIPRSLPSLEDLQAVYPRGMHIPVAELFELALRVSQPAQLVLPLRARLPRSVPLPPLPPPGGRV